MRIKEPFRADGLNRMLYKCPHCLTEGKMLGQGTTLSCQHCGETYELTEYGYLKLMDEKNRTPIESLRPRPEESAELKPETLQIPQTAARSFTHIPDWYRWERECVREEILSDTYRMEMPVSIYMLVNTKKICQVGEGTLTHSKDGFHLTGCDGKLDYHQEPLASYSLYSDFFWYEIGDMISIGTEQVQYYCFPQGCGDIVAKARLATEELYKIVKNDALPF